MQLNRTHAKRLAKGLSEDKADARVKRVRKGVAGLGVGGDSGRTDADARSASPLARLIQSLGQEKIRFRVDGLKGFDQEYRNAVTARLENQAVKVLPLKRILASKQTVMREKDQLHILLIERVLKGKKLANIKMAARHGFEP